MQGQDGAAEPIEGEYDYIIVGAGSAGCLLANRLSADPSKRVLVLEAGGRDNWIWFHIPVGYLFAIGNPRSDWCSRPSRSQGLNGRSLNYPRGKVIGGSSAINAMIYMRGQAADYDHWRQLGLAGWGWDDVLPYFKKHEDHFSARARCTRVGGELRIEAPRVRWDLLDAFRARRRTGRHQIGRRFQHRRQRGLLRVSRQPEARPALVGGRGLSQASASSRPNLRLETGCLVEGHCVRRSPCRRRALAAAAAKHASARCRGEVILAAGAIGSPQLMLLSGIGPAQHLRDTRHRRRRDRPGVGGNLQDHLQLRMIYKVEGIATLNERYHARRSVGRHDAEYALFRARAR